MNMASPTKKQEDSKKQESDKKGAAEQKVSKVDLGHLEEDDEFEEFPADESSATTGSTSHLAEEDLVRKVNVWEDNWDDDVVEDDFSRQLRAEVDKVKKAAAK